jgi:hypothetical protein
MRENGQRTFLDPLKRSRSADAYWVLSQLPLCSPEKQQGAPIEEGSRRLSGHD